MKMASPRLYKTIQTDFKSATSVIPAPRQVIRYLILATLWSFPNDRSLSKEVAKQHGWTNENHKNASDDGAPRHSFSELSPSFGNRSDGTE